ncbi:Adenylate isopentenyltransferase 3 [Hibiscus syriacus]|uniref:Adenylate isopentenyltransferase 3 n=1 Tax=Hibiscus syriacus TaxID=106335 RepID=A0A6A2Y734_HIBSY|nr:Adenylate isopentenyltransferase 3 [Hibiscus syriacus]
MSSLLDTPSGLLKSDFFSPRRHKEKVVILMGATGSGKSRLSIDLATRFPAEVINSDKIQVHEGLDIVTNKMTEEEQFRRHGFTRHGFDRVPSQLPIIAGGSNSFIEALVDDKHFRFRSKYECCFLWVDVAMPVLHQYVSERVDKMVENGMVDEVRNFFDSNANYSTGIGKAIGVHEFDRYFRGEPFLDKQGRAKLLQEAIQEIKTNTCRLACRQWEKINRLRNQKNWKIHQLDATEAFRRRGEESDEAWEELVAGPSTEMVAQFLYDISSRALLTSPAGAIRVPCGIML